MARGGTLADIARAAARCEACSLYRYATQTVFGEGRESAEVMLVGEQPGDREDLAGAPFVGPAGKLLDDGLADAGIDRASVYVTNVVKHFKYLRRGKRRIHQKPNAEEIRACRPWLDSELQLVKPTVLVCLGATAAQTLIGRTFRVSIQHGDFVASELAPLVTATVHPSSILRTPDDESRRIAYKGFVEDLTGVAHELDRRGIAH